MRDSIARNIVAIQNIFREVQDSHPEAIPLDELKQRLDLFEVKFRSIAYEAASFCIALKDLNARNELKGWSAFLTQIGTLHATQIHIGLGWAFAQSQNEPVDYFAVLNPLMRYRVFDGYGYYEGIFRKRKSVLSQQKPEWEDETAAAAYDQGLGRSLWYLNDGKIDDVRNLIGKFPLPRQKDLWRGIGIASSYVGGLDEEGLKEILSKSERFKTQLCAGAAMTAISRYYAGSLNGDIELVCNFWCNQKAEDIALKHNREQNQIADYSAWIEGIELDMAKAFS